MTIGPSTRFILSTSGRLNSLHRYRILLQELLSVDVAYVPISSPEGPIAAEAFAGALRGMNCIGGAISRDIKSAILPLLHSVSPEASRVGSVNTVLVRSGGRQEGHNTDALGFRAAIEQAIRTSPVPITEAVCYGYGGVCSVVVHVLRSLGVSTSLCGRRPEEAARRAAELGATVWTPEIRPQLLVNAAPVTDRPLEEAPFLLQALQGVALVFDHEMPGRYLEEHCRSHAVVHVPGSAMYWPQMEAQWALFLDGIVDSPSQVSDLLHQADQRVPRSSM